MRQMAIIKDVVEIEGSIAISEVVLFICISSDVEQVISV